MKRINTILMCLITLTCHVTFAKEAQLTLMLDWFVNPNHGPILVAQEQGYFQEEGLDVKILEPADPSTPAKLVAAQKFDLAITYQREFTHDLTKKLPLMRTSTLISTPLNCMMVLKKSGVTKLSQLEGKKIGYSTAGNERDDLAVMFEHDKQTNKTIQPIYVGWNLSQALVSGQVDAIYGAMRNVEKNYLELKGHPVVMFYPEEHGIPAYDELIFVAHNQTKKTDEIKRFNRALAKAVQFILNHPEQAWASFVAYKPKMLQTKENKRSWDDTIYRFAHRPSAVDLDRYQAYAVFLKNKGVIDHVPDFSKSMM